MQCSVVLSQFQSVVLAAATAQCSLLASSNSITLSHTVQYLAVPVNCISSRRSVLAPRQRPSQCNHVAVLVDCMLGRCHQTVSSSEDVDGDGETYGRVNNDDNYSKNEDNKVSACLKGADCTSRRN